MNYSDLFCSELFNDEFGKKFDKMYKNNNLYYENKITSLSEMFSCSDAIYNVFCNTMNNNSAINHNCGKKRVLSSSFLFSIVDSIKTKKNLCLITSREFMYNIMHILGKDFIKVLGIDSFYISDLIKDDRIFFINLADIYIDFPNLHGKIRDLLRIAQYVD